MPHRLLILSFLTMILAIAACKNGVNKQVVESQDKYQPAILIQKQGELKFGI